MQSPLRIAAAVLLTVGNIAVAFFLWQIREASAAEEVLATAKVARIPAAYSERGSDEPVAPILLTFDEVVANIGPYDSPKAHMLIVKLNVELFDESSRKLIERRQGGVKHTILELSRNQSLSDLKTLSGKVYFKEQIVSQLNAYLNQPVVKDVHFASFLLR